MKQKVIHGYIILIKLTHTSMDSQNGGYHSGQANITNLNLSYTALVENPCQENQHTPVIVFHLQLSLTSPSQKTGPGTRKSLTSCFLVPTSNLYMPQILHLSNGNTSTYCYHCGHIMRNTWLWNSKCPLTIHIKASNKIWFRDSEIEFLCSSVHTIKCN